MSFTYKENEISDLYKAVTGYRPREEFNSKWFSASMAEKREIWDSLVDRLPSDEDFHWSVE